VNFAYDERYGPVEIARRVQDVARRVTTDYPSDPLVLIGILKGGAFLTADLARALGRPVRLEYIDVLRGGEEEILDFQFVRNFHVTGTDLIIVKDVIRSGIIESYLMDQLREERPRSVRFACLVDRPQERKSSLFADYVLFPSEEGVMVGYGMEYRGAGGSFPFIATVRSAGDAPFGAAAPRTKAAG
jgi:hypoxanthine phosphoribosyltransferase